MPYKKAEKISFLGVERVVGCLCQCASEEMERECEKHRAEEELLHIRQMKSAGLQDSTFFDYTFANSDETHPCAKYARRYVEHFAEFQKNGQGLLFWGNVGTGKTFLAGCIANALMEKNIPVLMTSFPKLLNALGGLYSGEKNEYLKSLNQYRLLIIDDLGVERDTPYVLETVYLVIDERYKSGKSFIITTNLSLEELRNPADLEHGRIYDRIMERCVPVAFSGKNYRTDKGRKNVEDAAGKLRDEPA
ncbi:ATP-binding protein [Acetatifactor aquisgranensis]|uniref:ATP-binding protein n=1 Tax=Acetatifactor aquisgranensis TaxID=2941233 RepID=UPI00203D988D|nr:ATP-binding protein [Acetatifactor aquisgranensis]